MIDARQAWEDQEDLAALCRGRSEFEGVEELRHNDAYGFARALKMHAGYAPERPIKAVIPHGVYLDPAKMLDNEARSGLPAVLNYPAHRAQAWEAQGDTVVIPSASPFLYALDLFRDRFEPPEGREGTIFYCAHTIRGTRTTADWDEVAEGLLALEDRFQPVTVSLHTRDNHLGAHAAFARRGIPVVCAGNCGDPDFIFRWLHLLMRHEYAASNDVGSAVFYTVAAGVPTFLIDEVARHAFTDPTMLVLDRMRRDRAQVEHAREIRSKVETVFRADDMRLGDELVETVRYFLGAENFKRPEGLLDDLEYAWSLSG